MNKYEAPNMEVVEFAKNDVITTSGLTGGGANGNTGGGGLDFD